MRIVVFSGAGLSQESGIPTFRDAGGLWHEHRVEDVATLDGWARDRELVCRFYADRLRQIKQAQPNDAHKALARLGEAHEVFHLTQNIDDLLERANCRNVTHLHGEIASRRCTVCPCRFPQEEPVAVGDLCPDCGSQMRPDVVWFGEEVDMREGLLKELVPTTDCFIMVGSSAQVWPAAGLLQQFRHSRLKYYVDVQEQRRLRSFTWLRGRAGERVPGLVDGLLNG